MYVAKWPIGRAPTCDQIPKITSFLLLGQPTKASHNLAQPLPPPPPRLEGEDREVSRAAALEPSRRAVPDSDLDASVDLGEAIARTPALTPRPKSISASPLLPDHLSPMHDAALAPVIRERQLGKAASSYSMSVLHAPRKRHILIFTPTYSCRRWRHCCCGRSRPDAFSSWGFVTPRRSISEESEPY